MDMQGNERYQGKSLFHRQVSASSSNLAHCECHWQLHEVVQEQATIGSVWSRPFAVGGLKSCRDAVCGWCTWVNCNCFAFDLLRVQTFDRPCVIGCL